MSSMALLSPGTIAFNFLAQRTGSNEGGRKLFEELVVDVVGVKHPEVASVEANPGDWGIDAFIGDLLGGKVSIWQAKYFIDEFGRTQQGEVRSSYKAAQVAAAREGYSIEAWTLCVPCALDGPTRKWWEGWKRRTSRDDGVHIELWDAVQMRRRLQATDDASVAVREHYFNPVISVGQPRVMARPLQRLEDGARFDDALFIRQMAEANLDATRPAREAFFNAEILGQEVADKGVPVEVEALRSWRIRIASIWGFCINDALQRHSGDQLPGLYRDVLETIDQRHGVEAAPLGGSPVHGHGLIHQEVEDGRAGWVRRWEVIAQSHASRTVAARDANEPTLPPAVQERVHEQSYPASNTVATANVGSGSPASDVAEGGEAG
jgi:hypothetical protein